MSRNSSFTRRPWRRFIAGPSRGAGCIFWRRKRPWPLRPASADKGYVSAEEAMQLPQTGELPKRFDAASTAIISVGVTRDGRQFPLGHGWMLLQQTSGDD